MQYSELLEIRPLVFQSVFLLHTKNSACMCTLDSGTISIISSHARAAESPLPQEIHTQGGAEDKGHCPGYHMDQQNHSLAHGPSKSQQKWQLRRPALSTLHPPWHGLWSSIQLSKAEAEENPEKNPQDTCHFYFWLLRFPRIPHWLVPPSWALEH